MSARSPQHWRERAGDCRTELVRTTDPEFQRILGMLANACEEVAEFLEAKPARRRAGRERRASQ